MAIAKLAEGIAVVQVSKLFGQSLLVLDPELKSTTGKYFSGFQAIDSSPDSYDCNLAEQLWSGSIELTPLKDNETILNR